MYSCEDGIARLVMPNDDPRNGFFYSTQTLMIYSYNVVHENEVRTVYTGNKIQKTYMMCMKLFSILEKQI